MGKIVGLLIERNIAQDIVRNLFRVRPVFDCRMVPEALIQSDNSIRDLAIKIDRVIVTTDHDFLEGGR